MNSDPINLSKILEDAQVSKWGIGDIAGLHPLSDKFPLAVSLALAYRPSFKKYNENKYNDLLKQKRIELNRITAEILEVLDSGNISYHKVANVQENDDTLLADFPHKLAATRAGMGWIGKNSLLITPEFGPRIMLQTILIDFRTKCNSPITESRCGDCDVCVKSCPYDLIHDVIWYPGIDREKLFKPFICSSKRLEFKERLGHKHSCGLCLLDCPVGRPEEK